MIEGVTFDSKVKVDKLETIMAIYKELFEMTADDQIMLVNIVSFLHENKAFIFKKGCPQICIESAMLDGFERRVYWARFCQLNLAGATL